MAKGKKGGKRMTKKDLTGILVEFFQQDPEKTFSFKEIFKRLKLNTHPLKMLAIDIMEEMAWDDFLTRVTDSSYRLNRQGQTMEGLFIRKRTGKNSFQPDGTDQKPVFVAERNSMYALDGDRVRVTMMARRNKHIREAVVTEIIERKKTQFVGKVQIEHDVAYISPEGENLYRDIIVPKRLLHKASENDVVIVRVTEWPQDERGHIIGEVIANLGTKGENNTEMHAILAQYGLPYEYPREVEAAAERISEEITEADYAEREDFRDTFTCTIDPHDAKDFDDALSFRVISAPGTSGEKEPGKAESGALYEVGVHIADVSHYVKEGSVIDKEAQARATSVYLVDRTIPMLPERLCNFICSLRPNEEKLAYSVIFTLDSTAQIKDWRLVHTVIKSDRRFTYEEAQERIEKKTGDWQEEINILWDLARRLRERRFEEGSVKFDREEMRFDIDKDGVPVRCYFKKSKEANKLIEEFMLLANRTVAESIGKVKRGQTAKTLPYRIHDSPDPQKLEELKSFVAKLGYKMKSTSTKGATARAMNQLLEDCAGQKNQKVVEMVALRAMMKAKYSVYNIGHYGLAFDYYTHFTSPIRRYPDTMVHRLLTRYQQGAKNAGKDKYEELCKHSSEMEMTAAMAERDSIKYKMVEFMSKFIGEEFDAHISGVASYGIYCEIDDNHCEGMVPIRDLSEDYYEFDEKNFALVGRRHRHTYSLGDPVRIKVARANLDKRQLDFTLADEP
ncbi:MAG: ribonuclease R [Bacteroidales bacterium]|nr:ribonuclease R [Bacteroidales bacterium]MCM1146516.1 ribonuclease R [Bacteroidales bacterium]MCM1205908.1 ribonuclease R [Bacillota bacterium]MCM1510214.1 ribonuclease R [Clostridium sp.]